MTATVVVAWPAPCGPADVTTIEPEASPGEAAVVARTETTRLSPAGNVKVDGVTEANVW